MLIIRTTTRPRKPGALDKFIKDAGLPKPSAIVNTGGGAHVYFILDRALPPGEWQPLANALAEAARRHGLKADLQVTVDSARILRIPDTSNKKYDPPRPVELDPCSDFTIYSVDLLAEKLAPYKFAVPKGATSKTTAAAQTCPFEKPGVVIQGPWPKGYGLAEVFRDLPPDDALGKGIDADEASKEDIAAWCEFIKSWPAALAEVGKYNNWIKFGFALARLANEHPEDAEFYRGLFMSVSAATAPPGKEEAWKEEAENQWEDAVKSSKGERDRESTWRSIRHLAVKHGYVDPADEATRNGISPTGNAGQPAEAPPFVDLYQEFVGPPFPLGILPPVLADYVEAQHRSMGADPAAIALAVLAAVSGAIHGDTTVELGNDYLVRLIIWAALIGKPSAMKSPITDKVTRPLLGTDRERRKAWEIVYSQWKQSYAANKKTAGPPPSKPARCIIHDATVEKVTELLSRTSAGALMLHDELGGWIGGFENYGSSAAYSRGTFLKAWNGGYHTRDRVGRGRQDEDAETAVDNLALSILGNIQPDILAGLGDLTSDGFIQRFLVVLMRPAERGDEEYPVSAVEAEYTKLIKSVLEERPRALTFAPDAKPVRKRVLDKLSALEKTDGFSDAFIGAVGKLKSYFGRLAGVLRIADEHSTLVRRVFEEDPGPPMGIGKHEDPALDIEAFCNEANEYLFKKGAPPPSDMISRDVSERAERLIFEFVLPHTYGLYDVLVGGGKDRDTVRAIADFILTSKKERLVASDFTSGVRALRSQPNKVADWAGRFINYEWLKPGDDRLIPKSWLVAPGLREYFAERQQKAAKARAVAHAILRAGGTRPQSKQPPAAA
jgi:Protein of unknown function (DUF3987)